MSAISAGQLNHRIRIQQPTTVKDALGAPTQVWADVATVWADIQPLSGREARIADRVDQQLVAQRRAARIAQAEMCASISRAASMLGVLRSSQRRPARAEESSAVTGWATSCTIDATSSPNALSWLARASSESVSRI